jgi:hypothetical protein
VTASRRIVHQSGASPAKVASILTGHFPISTVWAATFLEGAEEGSQGKGTVSTRTPPKYTLITGRFQVTPTTKELLSTFGTGFLQMKSDNVRPDILSSRNPAAVLVASSVTSPVVYGENARCTPGSFQCRELSASKIVPSSSLALSGATAGADSGDVKIIVPEGAAGGVKLGRVRRYLKFVVARGRMRWATSATRIASARVICKRMSER